MLSGKSKITAHLIKEKLIKNYEIDQSVILNKGG